MKASIITVGDELLIGQVIDTNSAWISAKCQDVGIQVTNHISIADDVNEIRRCLFDLMERDDLLIFTGGLGPTLDDKTIEAIAIALEMPLVFDEDSWKNILDYYAQSGRTVSEIQKKQCMIPQGAVALHNARGTAPGVYLRYNNKHIACFPGVPHEMKYLFECQFLPLIASALHDIQLVHLTIKTAGIGESDLAERIADIEAALPTHISLAYLPAMGEVRLRLSGRSVDNEKLSAEIESYAQAIETRLGKFVYGRDQDTLVSVLADQLRKKGLKLSLAESCTGGNISAVIVRQPGVSDFYMGSAVTYSYEAKRDLLGVDMDLIYTQGAVSEAVVRQMAIGANERFGSDISAAISGIAGPDGGTPDKPVGTYWICLAHKGGEVRTFTFVYNRERNINIDFVTTRVLDALRLFVGTIES